MDRLTLQVVQLTLEGYSQKNDFVNVIVNGRNMVDIIKEVELPFAGDLAGDYHQLTPAYFLQELKRGSPVWILGCPCGEPGCWPLQVSVGVTDSTVVWSRFEQPYRSSREPGNEYWDYGNLGFTFDRGEYEAEVRKLEQYQSLRGLS
ncbi:MAG TPA: hypothetical protein VNT01_04020 [Symbiobacteriaceae bacterium]|nr:hypothetical protein [Symbiobacteriaceae bacterium]